MSGRRRRAKVIARDRARTPSVSRPNFCNRSMASKEKNGKVYLVGAGPGDLGLVTLRAKECIGGAEQAKAIVDAGITFEIVPGITSAIAGPAYAGIPVTHRADNSHVTFFTGHEDPSKEKTAIDYAALAKLGGTQVMLMGVEQIDAITREMLANGVRRDLPVALVRWATTGRQE